MKSPRLPAGSSDPLSFTCTCGAASTSTASAPGSGSGSGVNGSSSSSSNIGGGGVVILFYRYWEATPPLPQALHEHSRDLESLSDFHRQLTRTHSLGGKIRIANEGFNITVGGTSEGIHAYMDACMSHWSFASLDLRTEEARRAFFKPSSGGCACAFGGGEASVRMTAEITPLGITDYAPARWDGIEVLSAEEFHERCWDEERKVLVDVRNHYESRIGYFVDPRSGREAVRPLIRRFSQFPRFAMRFLGQEGVEGEGEGREEEGGRRIMTYCTGGIRCEKGVRWMQENMQLREGDKICTLQGGIAAYLMWMDSEIRSGRKTASESLFRGRNYVFDARGSTGLSDGMGPAAAVDPVATCHVCAVPSDRLSKCRSRGCHLVLVVCASCEMVQDPRCCESCQELDDVVSRQGAQSGPRPVCRCEKEREAQLWGDDSVKPSKVQGWKKRRKAGNGAVEGINIHIKTID